MGAGRIGSLGKPTQEFLGRQGGKGENKSTLGVAKGFTFDGEFSTASERGKFIGKLKEGGSVEAHINQNTFRMKGSGGHRLPAERCLIADKLGVATKPCHD